MHTTDLILDPQDCELIFRGAKTIVVGSGPPSKPPFSCGDVVRVFPYGATNYRGNVKITFVKAYPNYLRALYDGNPAEFAAKVGLLTPEEFRQRWLDAAAGDNATLEGPVWVIELERVRT